MRVDPNDLIEIVIRFYLNTMVRVLAFLKFALVGVLTTAIYFVVVWLTGVVFELSYIVTVSTAYFMSTVFNFLANRHFTFAAADSRYQRQIVRYLIIWFINYLIMILVVETCVEGFHLSPYIGVCISVLFTMCVGYFLGRYWAFKGKEVTV